MPQFTRQQKLALALTSAGSQRALARQLGVTHQQVGRWLREGENLHIDAAGNVPRNKDGTEKRYGGAPEWIAEQLNWVFDVHKKICKEQCRVDGTPYNQTVPVYIERRYLSGGASDWIKSRKALVKHLVENYGKDWQKDHQIEFAEGIGYRIRKVGDRVISGPTEFIREDQRKKWIAGMVASQKFYKVNVRSIIDLKHYFDRVATEELESGRRQRISKKKLAFEISQAWINKERREKAKIIDRAEPFPMYTMSQDARPGSDPFLIAQNVEDMLQQKHSPATSFPGTHFADEYLLQLLPANYVRPNRRKPLSASAKTSKPASKRTRK